MEFVSIIYFLKTIRNRVYAIGRPTRWLYYSEHKSQVKIHEKKFVGQISLTLNKAGYTRQPQLRAGGQGKKHTQKGLRA